MSDYNSHIEAQIGVSQDRVADAATDDVYVDKTAKKLAQKAPDKAAQALVGTPEGRKALADADPEYAAYLAAKEKAKE